MYFLFKTSFSDHCLALRLMRVQLLVVFCCTTTSFQHNTAGIEDRSELASCDVLVRLHVLGYVRRGLKRLTCLSSFCCRRLVPSSSKVLRRNERKRERLNVLTDVCTLEGHFSGVEGGSWLDPTRL